MSFIKYPAYKKSSIPYIDLIPSHWQLKKIAWDVPYRVGWTPSSGNEDYYGGDVPWVTISDLDKKTVRETKSTITELAVAERGARPVPAGSLLFSFKLSVGKVAFTEINCFTNEAIAAFEPNKAVELSYWYYASPIIIPHYGRDNIYGAKLLNQDLIGSVKFYCPTQLEQQKIAQFLDYETAKIDALIDEQKRLIELLKEKRQAVISHAVTKGLNPDAPMKDSGVEWIGQIPDHWHTLPIKYVINSFEQGWSPQCFNEPVSDESELGVLKVGCVRHGRFIHEENKRLPPGLPFKNELSVRAGDLLISRANTRELVGSVGVPSVNHENLMISDKIFRLRLNSQALPEFLCFFLTTGVARQQIELAATGASDSMLNIGQSTIKEMPFPCPPMVEQHKIVDRVVKANWKLLELAGEAIKLVEKLKERRTALISAAVTGKIDVRDWQPPQGSDTVEKKESAQTEMQHG